jgi:hypothetical protein
MAFFKKVSKNSHAALEKLFILILRAIPRTIILSEGMWD